MKRPCPWITAQCLIVTLQVSGKPCTSYWSFKLFEISASEFGTINIRRRFRTCSDEFLTTVTEGVVHGVNKVVIQSFFSEIPQHKAN